MEAAGFTPEDYAHDAIEVWPDNWAAWELFCTMGTQWRTSMSGVTGLDYGPLFTVMQHLGLQGQDWLDMLSDIRTLESAALEQIRTPT